MFYFAGDFIAGWSQQVKVALAGNNLRLGESFGVIPIRALALST